MLHAKYCSTYVLLATWNEVLFQQCSSLFTTLQARDYHYCTRAASVPNLAHNAIRLTRMMLLVDKIHE